MSVEQIRATIENAMAGTNSQCGCQKPAGTDFMSILSGLMSPQQTSWPQMSTNSDSSSVLYGPAADIAAVHLQHSIELLNSSTSTTTSKKRGYGLQLIKSPTQPVRDTLIKIDQPADTATEKELTMVAEKPVDTQVPVARPVEPIIIELRISLSMDAAYQASKHGCGNVTADDTLS